MRQRVLCQRGWEAATTRALTSPALLSRPLPPSLTGRGGRPAHGNSAVGGEDSPALRNIQRKAPLFSRWGRGKGTGEEGRGDEGLGRRGPGPGRAPIDHSFRDLVVRSWRKKLWAGTTSATG